MKKNDKGSEDNSQKQTRKKSVGTPVENGGRPNHAIKDDMAGITPEMIEEARPKPLLTKEQMESLTKGDIVELTDEQRKAVNDSSLLMDPITLYPENSGSIGYLDSAADHHPDKDDPLMDRFKDTGSSDKEYTPEQLMDNRMEYLLRNGFTDEGVFLRIALENENDSSVMLIAKDDIMNNEKFHECVKAVSLHKDEYKEVLVDNYLPEGVAFLYTPASMEKVEVGGHSLWSCEDADLGEVVYIPVEYATNISFTPGTIQIPMWLAELKHLV